MYDIKAEIAFIPADLGGRRMPTCSGWRPQFRYCDQEEPGDWDVVFFTDEDVE